MIRKKVTSKVVSVILIMAIIIIQMSINCTASEQKANNDMEYIRREVKTYVQASSPNVSNVTISKPVVVYNLETKAQASEAYFVIDSDSPIGMLLVASNDGNKVSTYYTNLGDEIVDAYKSEEEIALGNINDDLVLINTAKITSLFNNDIGELTTILHDIGAKSNLHPITKSNSTVNTASERSVSVVVDKYLSVPYVSNDGPNCWAASIASTVNYVRGTNLNVSTLLSLLNQAYPGEMPIGSFLWFQRAYNLFSLNVVNYSSPVGYSSIYGSLMSNYPVNIDVFRTDYNNNRIGHELVIDGIYVLYSPETGYYGGYRVVDSNTPYTAWVNVSSETLFNGTGFVYIPAYASDRIYNDWTCTHMISSNLV